MPTTEIAVIPLIAGTSVGDPDSHAAAVMRDTVATLHQQDGLQNVHFGSQVESPDVLQMMISKTRKNHSQPTPSRNQSLIPKLPDWTSRQHHETFMASAAYQPFVKRLGTIMSTNATIHHVDFEPTGSLAKAFSSPVTEIATFYCDREPIADWLSNASKAAKWLEEQPASAGYVSGSASYGITHEVVEYEGVKGKAAVIAIGWTSKEAHVEFRGTQTFRENIGLLRGEAEKIEMHHVVLMEGLRD
jgi:hypothetical protein